MFTLVAILIALGVHVYEHFLSEAEAAEIVETGAKTKVDTKTFICPQVLLGK